MGWTWILSTLLAQILIDLFVNIYEEDVSNAEVSYWNHLLSFSNFQILRWEDGQELWALKLNTPPKRTPHPSNQDHYFRILILIKINQKCRKYIDFFIVIILPKYHLVPSAVSCLHWSSSSLPLKNPTKIHAMFSILFIFFGFSFRLTLEVCFILMGLSQKA